jgi:hypothetical protein
MDKPLLALLFGVPVGVVLTVIQLAIARRQIVRGLQLNPPPDGARHRDRYLAKPLLSTVGLVFPLSLVAAMSFGATLLAYIILSR